MRVLGAILILFAALGALGEWRAIELPTVRWPFAMSRDFSWLRVDEFLWFGWLSMVLAALAGLTILFRFCRSNVWSPIVLRRIQRFKALKRGYFSMIIILILASIASLDHILVGNEALVVKYEGRWYFPAFTRDIEKGVKFGEKGDLKQAPADYRLLKSRFAESENRVIMPIIPYAPTGDSITAVASPLTERDGLLMKGGKQFSGLGSRIYDQSKPERQHLRFTYRNGKKSGPADGWDEEGSPIYSAEYKEGNLVEDSVSWNGDGKLEDFLNRDSSNFLVVHYNPAPPIVVHQPRHLLGTTPQGYDVLAYLFGGLQVNFKAALIYIPVVYLIGITVGLLMGYFGGTFDIVVQRIIEILSNVPFLFVIMIASTSVPDTVKDKAGLGVILGLLACFGWMGMTYLMRTSALKEKAKDYIAASRVLGASTGRILYRHLLPNSIAIIVTLIPFSVSAVVLSLTSLDYLGFGLPEKYASWGKLLKFGLEQLSSPWLVTSAFFSLVSLLVLVTFVGEAVREAFDPKKFTYYR
jgi:microcin C transport system permease protein